MQLRFEGSEWEGIDGMTDEIFREMRPRAEGAVKKIVLLGESLVKKLLTGRRSGRVYRVSRTGALHVASAPGEPPAVMFGNLRNSVGHTEPAWEGDAVSAQYGPGLAATAGGVDPASYALRMEYGGVDSRGIMIEPRPYMGPAAAQLEPIAQQILEAEL